MARPAALVPFRWQGHFVDVWAHIALGQPLFAAKDICEALELAVTADYDSRSGRTHSHFPGQPIELDWVTDRDGQKITFYDIAGVHRVATDHPSYLTAEFLTWFDELIAQLDTAAVESLIEALDKPPSPLAAAGGSNYSVARAARILSHDPALDYGQTALFDTMRRALNWVQRVDGVWRATAAPIRKGWLFEQGRRISVRRELYPQIRVTRHGLEQLHARLGGVATLRLDTPPDLTLLELPR